MATSKGEERCVQLTVRPFGIVKDPITNNDESVQEYIWTNSKTKTTVKVSFPDDLLFLTIALILIIIPPTPPGHQLRGDHKGD